MMYCGEPPWHGLGTRLDGPATAVAAMRAAGLDWKVVLKPLVAYDDDKKMEVVQPVPGRFAIVRDDQWGKPDCRALGIVGRQYRPLQNREAFAFLDPLVGPDAAVYHTAGALGDGERVWLLAKLPGELVVAGGDVTEKYLLLSNSHDGQSSVQLKFTPIRVVCQNTLTMALERGPTLRVPHTSNLERRLALARDAIDMVQGRFERIGRAFDRMAEKSMGGNRLVEYLERVFPEPVPRDGVENHANGSARARVVRDRSGAAHLFAHGRGNDAPRVRGTLWAAYNGVAESVDHRTGPQTGADRRLSSAWFGDGYRVKARAYREAMHLAGTWANN
jgi:phage/plasmid-like protein (TIGR03299 family)